MSHYCKFGCALWATAADLVIRYGPLRRIWFCAMGHSAGFGYPLWAVAKDFVKGTVAWDFLSEVISPKVPNWSSDSWCKAVLNTDSNSPRYSTSKVFPRYGRIFLCAMGHYGEFGCALWATAADLVIRYVPPRRIWLCAMGHWVKWSRTV